MKYSEKLKHPKWQKKRLEILNRDNFTCCLCGDNETELHIHHLKYIGNNPCDTPNNYLETLCKHCHWLKTFCDIKDYGTFIKSSKTNDLIFVLNDKKQVLVFTKNENSEIEHLFTINKNSVQFDSLISFCKKSWDITENYNNHE